MKLIERFGEWSLDRLPSILTRVSIFLFLVLILVQVTMWQTRKDERQAMAEEQARFAAALEADNRMRIRSLEAEVERLEADALIAKIIECESGGRHDGVWGDGGKSYGWLQFKKRSFEFLSRKMGFEGADWKNKDHQLRVAEWALKNGWGHWWACYQKVERRERSLANG